MVKVYDARVDLWVKVSLIVGLAAVCVAMALFYSEHMYGGFLSMLAVAVLVPLFMFPAKYTLYDDYFTVQCGLIKLTYLYRNIKDVVPSDKPFSLSFVFALQVAFSFKVVHIRFKKGNFSLLISPRKRDEFIEDLRERITNDDSPSNEFS